MKRKIQSLRHSSFKYTNSIESKDNNNQEEILSNAYKKNAVGQTRLSRQSINPIIEDIKNNNQGGNIIQFIQKK